MPINAQERLKLQHFLGVHELRVRYFCAHANAWIPRRGRVCQHELRGRRIEAVKYEETWHYQNTRQFLECPERFLKHLFDDSPEGESDA